MAEKEVITANTRGGLKDFEVTHTGEGRVAYEPPDELTQREIAEALTIMRAIKRQQRGYMLVSPDFNDRGRGLYIVGPLEKQKAA